MLIVDDAHGIGVLGKMAGVAEHFQLTQKNCPPHHTTRKAVEVMALSYRVMNT